MGANNYAEVFGAGIVFFPGKGNGVGYDAGAFPAVMDNAKNAGYRVIQVKRHTVGYGNAGNQASVGCDYAVTDFILGIGGGFYVINYMGVVQL